MMDSTNTRCIPMVDITVAPCGKWTTCTSRKRRISIRAMIATCARYAETTSPSPPLPHHHLRSRPSAIHGFIPRLPLPLPQSYSHGPRLLPPPSVVSPWSVIQHSDPSIVHISISAPYSHLVESFWPLP